MTQRWTQNIWLMNHKWWFNNSGTKAWVSPLDRSKRVEVTEIPMMTRNNESRLVHETHATHCRVVHMDHDNLTQPWATCLIFRHLHFVLLKRFGYNCWEKRFTFLRDLSPNLLPTNTPVEILWKWVSLKRLKSVQREIVLPNFENSTIDGESKIIFQ